MTATAREFKREAEETARGLSILAGTVAILSLVIMGGIAGVLITLSLSLMHGAVRP